MDLVLHSVTNARRSILLSIDHDVEHPELVLLSMELVSVPLVKITKLVTGQSSQSLIKIIQTQLVSSVARLTSDRAWADGAHSR